MDKYHAKSDLAMDRLTEQIEELFDEVQEPTYEVDLHVRCGHLSVPLSLVT